MWSISGFQTNEKFIIYAKQYQLKRKQPDKSILEFNVTNLNNKHQQLNNGQSIQLNLSISHLLSQTDGSHSNAYNIDIFIYYDTAFIQLQSIHFVEKDRFSLAPVSNTTHNTGLIHFHTNTLWLLNNQHLSVHFKVTIPTTILKGDKCSGELLIDFKYLTNLQQFNGTNNNTLAKVIPYRCKIDQWKDVSLKSVRLQLSQLSMVFDDVNGEFVFCLHKVSFKKRNGPFCYRQIKERDEWIGMSEMAVVLGIDKTSRILYGIDRTGKVYLQSSYPFNQFYQIEDSLWLSKESNPITQKAITVNDVSALSLNPTANYIISDTSGIQVWAATKLGILKRKEGVLTRVVKY